jgi:4'-phosphopantetheinyl transferase
MIDCYNNYNMDILSTSIRITDVRKILGIETGNNLSPIEDLYKNKFILHSFGDEEIAVINQIKIRKKQIEWISGRLAVKKAVALKTKHRMITVLKKSNGAPFIKEHPEWNVSISHSNDYAVGAVCISGERKIGIDIEKINANPSNEFLRVAFSKNEIEKMGNCTVEIIFKNWTIKEAFLKYIEMGFSECLHHVEVIDNMIYYKKVKEDGLMIQTNIIDNGYMLSMVTNEQ